MNVYFGHVNHQLWNWTLAGLGYLTPELAQKELDNYTRGRDLEKQLEDYKNVSKDLSTFQQFIKNEQQGTGTLKKKR
jgi:hypothetical protein